MRRCLFLRIKLFQIALAVAFGAFGAHALRNKVKDEKILKAYDTGAHYHLIHAFPILFCSFLSKPHSTIAGSLFLCGTVLFSGSLYGMGLTENKKFGMITPFGGVSFIAGWLV